MAHWSGAVFMPCWALACSNREPLHKINLGMWSEIVACLMCHNGRSPAQVTRTQTSAGRSSFWRYGDSDPSWEPVSVWYCRRFNIDIVPRSIGLPTGIGFGNRFPALDFTNDQINSMNAFLHTFGVRCPASTSDVSPPGTNAYVNSAHLAMPPWFPQIQSARNIKHLLIILTRNGRPEPVR